MRGFINDNDISTGTTGGLRERERERGKKKKSPLLIGRVSESINKKKLIHVCVCFDDDDLKLGGDYLSH